MSPWQHLLMLEMREEREELIKYSVTTDQDQIEAQAQGKHYLPTVFRPSLLLSDDNMVYGWR